LFRTGAPVRIGNIVGDVLDLSILRTTVAVAADQRRAVKGHLHRELLKHSEQEPKIQIASATFEIVGVPPIRLTQSKSNGS